MNRLTNEERLQIIKIYYSNACSVKQFHRALLPFYGQLIKPLPCDDIQLFLQKMQEIDLQDGAALQTAHVTMDLLRGELDEHFISRSKPVNWPPRSCDLPLLDYFLWGYIKAHVYTDKPASTDALEDNIEAFIREIPFKKLQRVCQNWT